ncbi:hypothetical protein B0H14DRAFT_2715097, partial [Mycena olivaceomarginata]
RRAWSPRCCSLGWYCLGLVLALALRLPLPSAGHRSVEEHRSTRTGEEGFTGKGADYIIDGVGREANPMRASAPNTVVHPTP